MAPKGAPRTGGSRSPRASPDVVVVGGGLVGAACTYFLAAAGVRVLLLERGELASGASGACQSHVGVGVGMTGAIAYWKAALQAHALLRERELDEGYRVTGGLAIAVTNSEAEALTREVAVVQRAGIRCDLVGPTDLRRLEPVLTHAIRVAAFQPDSAQVDPRRTIRSLAAHARRLGARFGLAQPVTGVSVQHGRVTGVKTATGQVSAGAVVIAAGAWSREVGGFCGLRIPVWPRKGHLLVTGSRRRRVRHLLFEYGYEATLGRGFHTPDVRTSARGDGPAGEGTGLDGPPVGTPEVGMVVQPLPSGPLLVGSSREFAGHDGEPSRERLAQILVRARWLLPGLDAVPAVRSSAGLRPWSPDGLPLVGACDGIGGLYLATGHGGGGITGGPLAGRLIADLISGRRPVIDPRPLRPDRFGPRLYA